MVNQIPKQPSAEAIDMLARLMLRRAERESLELAEKVDENKRRGGASLNAKQLLLPLVTRIND